MNSTLFNMIRDINGFNGFGLPFAYDKKSCVLAAGVEQHFTVPSNYPNWLIIFSFTPGSAIWVDGKTTAVAPTGAFAATSAEMNPTARSAVAGQTISFITSDITSPMVSVILYVIPPYQN